MPGVAFLRLNTADRHQRLAADIHHVATQCEGKQRRFRKAQLS
jgi:hypothetical protein